MTDKNIKILNENTFYLKLNKNLFCSDSYLLGNFIPDLPVKFKRTKLIVFDLNSKQYLTGIDVLQEYSYKNIPMDLCIEVTLYTNTTDVWVLPESTVVYR